MTEALLLDPKAWLAVGAVLVIADMLLGFGNFALAVGVASGLMAGILFGQDQAWFGTFLTSWRGVALTFAALALLSVIVLRLAAYGRKPEDINRY